MGLWACRWLCSASLPSLSLVPSFLVGFRSLLAGSIGSTPLHWERLNLSGRLVLLCSSFFWVVRGFPASVRLSVLPRSGFRSCLGPLMSLRTTGNGGKGAAVPSFLSVLIG